jgi:hypothetical protein
MLGARRNQIIGHDKGDQADQAAILAALDGIDPRTLDDAGRLLGCRARAECLLECRHFRDSTAGSGLDQIQRRGTATAKDAIIECVEDARTVGLWNFAPLHPSAQENAQEGPAAASASTSASASASTSAAASASTSAAASAAALAEMDPVNEHRAWSPWLETVGNDSVPAWMRVLALLLPSASAGRTMAGAPSTTPTSAAISQIIAAF